MSNVRTGQVQSAAAALAQATKGASARRSSTAHIQQGWREIGGRRIYFRARMEANYARYLEWLRVKGDIASWDFETETFWFSGIKRGCTSYKPDFRVVENSGRVIFHETKGWLDPKSKTKLKRMAKYHPNVLLLLVTMKTYASVAKVVAPLIEGWE